MVLGMVAASCLLGIVNYRIYINSGWRSPTILQSATATCASVGSISTTPRRVLRSTIDIAMLRRDYGEAAHQSPSAILRGRMVIVCWTPRGNDRRIISMRKANEREKARYGQKFELSTMQSTLTSLRPGGLRRNSGTDRRGFLLAAFGTTAASRVPHGPGADRNRKVRKRPVSLRLDPDVARAFPPQRTRLAEPHQRGAAQSGEAVGTKRKNAA